MDLIDEGNNSLDEMDLNDDFNDNDQEDYEEDNNDDEMPPLETTSSETAARKKVRGSRLRSKCWKHFKLGVKHSDGSTDVTCKHCGKAYCLHLRQNGTNTMLRHSRSCSKTPGGGNTPRSSNRKLDMMVFREMIAVALIHHNLPYSFVEYEKIREAFTYANPDIEFWCRNTAAADVLKIYEKEKRKLKESLIRIPGRICFTTDLWRALTMEGYLCLTAHYVDIDGILKTKIISFCAFPPPHTAIAIAMKLVELLKEWGLEKKVFSLTVDNASANDSMQGILKRKLQKDLVCSGEFFHVRCSAHILNLIVQDGLDVIGDAVEKIRDSVKFVKASESREIMFQNCMETVGIPPDEPGLVMDVSTRWNSTHLMLSRAINFKEVFRNFKEVERSYTLLPSDLEWERGEMICEFLKPFAEITKLISGSSYPTSNLYFMQVWNIKMWLNDHEDSDDQVIREMVEPMQEKFDKYWEEFSDILAIAAVFDPRLKLPALEFCYTALEPSSSKSHVSHIRSKMVKLFGAYKSDTNNITTSQARVSRTDLPSGYAGLYSYFSQKTGGNGKSPLDTYLEEPALDMIGSKDMNIIEYWTNNSGRFKELSCMALDVLSIPITTVASESSFSIGSRVLNKYRSCLLPTNVQALICARNWSRGFQEIGDDEFKSLGEKEKEKEKDGSKN